GPRGPRLLAFGDPDHAGIALNANLADFIEDDASDDELLLALNDALQPVQNTHVSDISEQIVARQGALRAEALRVSSALSRLYADEPAPSSGKALVEVSAEWIRSLIRMRRRRDRFLPPEIFGDPAWDMLLDLTAARLEVQAVSVSSLCIAAAVPTTTALRWIRNLCDAGLFERRGDPEDGRRAFIGLAAPTAAAMLNYLGTSEIVPGV
ncbi:MAG: winged helix DNA-binding protein, partial [Janthinobacterium lividum]